MVEPLRDAIRKVIQVDGRRLSRRGRGGSCCRSEEGCGLFGFILIVHGLNAGDELLYLELPVLVTVLVQDLDCCLCFFS
jgi:hypothetical protein